LSIRNFDLLISLDYSQIIAMNSAKSLVVKEIGT